MMECTMGCCLLSHFVLLYIWCVREVGGTTHSHLLESNLFLVMEKSKSMPEYPSYVKAQYAFEDRPRAYSFNGPSNTGDEFGSSANPEGKRKKRVASYNMYAVEGKLKSSLRNSYKWIKSKFYDNYFDA